VRHAKEDARHRRHRQDRAQLQQPHLRLRIAQFLCLVPRGARHRSQSEKYFGALQKQSETRFQEVQVPAYVPMATLERALKIDADRLRALNPALAAFGVGRPAARAQGLSPAAAPRGLALEPATCSRNA